MRNKSANSRHYLVMLVLVLMTLAVFGSVVDHQFLIYDDPSYIAENPAVKGGLTAKGIVWAFTTDYRANWYPLTWLSHMLDVELFGLDARGHHLVNLLFHIFNTVLLFLVLRGMTGALWRSALVAALFAVHPLHVEPVAWIAERTGLLSAFFWMLTMGAYLRYARRPGSGAYAVVVLSFALGLMAKPIIVTLPFVLLLLDYWPLGRFSLPVKGEPSARPWWKAASPLLLEKVPLFALSAASSVITYLSQSTHGAVKSVEAYPLVDRVANIPVAYAAYIAKMVWPGNLSFYHYESRALVSTEMALSCAVLAVLCAIALLNLRNRPYLAVGWFWYLGTLVPVIGIVQVGEQTMADRYTYIPLIGLFIMAAWGIAELSAGWSRRREILVALASAVVLTLMAVSWVQVGHWRNSVTLFSHAVSVSPDDWKSHLILAIALRKEGRTEEADAHHEEAKRLRPDFEKRHAQFGITKPVPGARGPGQAKGESQPIPLRGGTVDPVYAKALFSLGNVQQKEGKLEEALASYNAVIRSKPEHAPAHNNLGVVLNMLGRSEESLFHYREALRINPEGAVAHRNMGNILLKLKRYDEAIEHYVTALEIAPDHAHVHNNLGRALESKGRRREALDHYQEALRIKPDFPEARKNMESARSRRAEESRGAIQ